MYCMPEEGTDLTPKDALLTTAEILRLVSFAMIVAMIVVVVLLAMLTNGDLIPHVYSALLNKCIHACCSQDYLWKEV